MTTIVCVLRSGGDFGPEWVEKLYAGVREHAPGVDFWCLTDVDVPGVECIPLPADAGPGWWAKVALFHPAMTFDSGRRYLYLDLDTIVTGDLADLLAYDGDFAMLSGFYRPALAESGVMAWAPGPHTEAIWHAFQHDPHHAMTRVRRDGRFIASHVECDRLQERYPDQIVSLKVHALRGLPGGARLVCGHGRPRLSDPASGWAHAHWVGLAS